MFVDSHCHIDFPDLAANMTELLSNMENNSVTHALCVCVDLPDFPRVLAVAESQPHIFASVGVHPDYLDTVEPTADQLVALASHPKVVAIGETGLDYYRLTGDLEWQRERFRQHIRAAKMAGLPLIVHTRESAADTIVLMKEEGAEQVGGVLHCFTETLDIALKAIEMGFYISFSGIVTFKNAVDLKHVAATIPLDRILIETDSPYLAPVPFRGKTNQPAYVRHVAGHIAVLRGISLQEVAAATTQNFFRLFSKAAAQ